MPDPHKFEHLPLLRRYQGTARIFGGGRPAPQTVANRQAYLAHGRALQASAAVVTSNWQSSQALRQQQNLPVIKEGVPVLLQVDPGLELDVLREKFDFEVVAEQEEGYVIVASRDIDLKLFVAMATAFAVNVHGSATAASIHTLFDDPNQIDRLRRILSERLFAEWPSVADAQKYVVDVGISCMGTQEIPPVPERNKTDSDAEWANKQSEWARARADAYNSWDEIKVQREAEILELAGFYQAEILSFIDGAASGAAVLPDSFTIRLAINGKGLKDFVLNYPYIFEVVEPEDIALPQRAGSVGAAPASSATPLPPSTDARAVCVIDSGIQEGHVLLEPAIDHATSHCFVPGKEATDIGDYVPPAGHGTRVAGAVLYGESVAKDGSPQLPFWIQNARVLDEHNRMPVELFPPAAIRAAVERFHLGPRHARIFNHSINATGYCRTRYMSSWAAEIDMLSNALDVLIVQSAGNLGITGSGPFLGMKDQLDAGRDYPFYLYEPACRIANPGQSLQALTVGSVAYGAQESQGWAAFAPDEGHPSAFSRSGFGIWNVIKPEVVERGGDAIYTGGDNADVQIGGRIPGTCPELVRSTMFPPGPAYDRDQAGTSFAAPKVTRIAALLEATLPDEPALLYRALIVQSARWPVWAEAKLTELRQPDLKKRDPARRTLLLGEVANVIRCLGYGVPDEDRATTNTDYRTTFITSGDIAIKASECHLYQVPVPPQLRNQADDFDIRIDVTLSYAAQPRRTRRNLRRYLSTWVEWKSNKLGERMNTFRQRAMKNVTVDDDAGAASVLPWTLHEMPHTGLVRDTRRNAGTVQKDWAVVKSNTLPDHFCLAVIGHAGWSRDPDSSARYTMAVTFEILGQEIPIYEPLRMAVLDLQEEVEAEVDAGPEAEVEVEE
jgi:hypothetical protein